jgi:hypothetical protein
VRFWLIVGVLQLLTGVLILQRNEWGFWLGVGFACVSALMTVFVMSSFTVGDRGPHADFLILYALLSRSDKFTG